MTTSTQSLKTFMRFHGLLVLKIWIRTYKSDPSLCEYVCSYLIFIYKLIIIIKNNIWKNIKIMKYEFNYI